MKVAVLGAGAWGTATAVHLASQPDHRVVLWARDPALVAAMSTARENAAYLPNCRFPDALEVNVALEAAARHAQGDADLLVLATPVAGLRAMLHQLAAADLLPHHLVWLCKGFEAESQLLPHQVVASVLAERLLCGAGGKTPLTESNQPNQPNRPPAPLPTFGALTGPSFAKEVAQGLPVALTAASDAAICRERVQQAFHHRAMRIYTSDDVVGVEVGGAVKNVLAIATGIADGLGLGMNARAALVTRGLAEMTRLGLALGARADTFTGLSGVGDLILTATGDLSRNRTVGMRLASGQSLSTVLAELGHVAEGVRCARAVSALAESKGVDMPITRAVCRVLFDAESPQHAVQSLLQRDARPESDVEIDS